MKNVLRTVTSVLVLLFGLGIAATAYSENLKWKFGNHWPDKHPASKALKEMFADVKAKTGGGDPTSRWRGEPVRRNCHCAPVQRKCNLLNCPWTAEC